MAGLGLEEAAAAQWDRAAWPDLRKRLAGGRALESLARSGWLSAVFDVTSTELADELGVFRSDPTRFTEAGAAGIPEVVSVGALDMVNFGPFCPAAPLVVSGRALWGGWLGGDSGELVV